jgi:hypothetical protein
MRVSILVLCILFPVGSACGAGPTFYISPESPGACASRDAFYCQPPIWASANASSGYGSEMADDIPDALAGQGFNVVTLYVSEWLAPWADPQGLAVNIYDGACPPPLTPYRHYEFGWNELEPEQAYYQPGYMTVYMVTASLPETFTITTQMSVGGYVINDWGDVAPYCGFCLTEFDAGYGCDELFWDDPLNGVIRWTRFYDAYGYHADLAYCLSEELTDAPDPGALTRRAHLGACSPNPFNPLTRIEYRLAESRWVRLGVYTVDGRLVATLVDGFMPEGCHEALWRGCDNAGRAAASGTYFYRLQAGDDVQTGRMSLVR